MSAGASRKLHAYEAQTEEECEEEPQEEQEQIRAIHYLGPEMFDGRGRDGSAVDMRAGFRARRVAAGREASPARVGSHLWRDSDSANPAFRHSAWTARNGVGRLSEVDRPASACTQRGDANYSLAWSFGRLHGRES